MCVKREALEGKAGVGSVCSASGEQEDSGKPSQQWKRSHQNTGASVERETGERPVKALPGIHFFSLLPSSKRP